MLIAGPCSIENSDQAFRIAKYVKECGGTHFRGGCFKGQNYPIVNGKPEYIGLGEEGLKILKDIQKYVGLPCVCDAQSFEQVESILYYGIEYLMIGARNMDNLALLREVNKLFNQNKINKKIILKRGPSATINEFLGAAEHLGGASRVILCERGNVHYDRHDYTRFRLDIQGVAELKHYYPEYQVLVDPSHASGDRNLVYLLSKCALEIADGLMIEVHYDPDSSPTDAPQIIDFKEFRKIARMYYEKRNSKQYLPDVV